MKLFRALAAAAIIAACPAGSLLSAALDLTVTADREDCLYALGDTVSFAVRCSAADAVIEYRLSVDGKAELERGWLELRGGEAVVRGMLDMPGFLRLDLTAVAGADTVRRAWGCAVAPLAIRAAGALPDDFDRFWGQGKAELLRIPLDARIEAVPGDEHESTLYRISLANLEGSRIYCWYRVPKGQGPFPAVLAIPGAGVRREGTRENYAEAGFAVLTIAIHGVGQDHELEYYDQLGRGLLAGYQRFGMDDPYRYYYRRVILGLIRCLDFLSSREEVDQERIAVQGSSQGGGLSLLVASLDKRVKALASNVPALCDHAGSLHGRPAGWPQLLNHAGATEREQVMRTMGYYDAATAASRIEVPALLAAGFIDGVCAPTTVLAAFNNLKGPRWIEMVPGMGHASPKGRAERWPRWLRDALDGKITDTRLIRGER
ncbi:MAG: acetylxylan esterase [Candidatus Glassbacteria bacterium]|nr:acetylxylan esterase [Candidatus Glassbacteria bacterium]